MRIGRRRRWWHDKRNLVALPDKEITAGDRILRVSSPRWIAIEETHDLRESPGQILSKTDRRARRVWSLDREHALYKIDEPPAGRSASGHWVNGRDGMVLTAVCLVPASGFPLHFKGMPRSF